MRRLQWGRSARRDVQQIARWYGGIDVDLSLRLIDAIERSPLALIDHPHLGASTFFPPVRKWPIKDTPFVLLYVPTSRTIEVRRVVDARSDWQRR